MKMSVTIGEKSFTATLENNAATHELVKMMEKEPISIDMDDSSGFEKAGPVWKMRWGQAVLQPYFLL